MLKKINATHFEYHGIRYKIKEGWKFFIVNKKHLILNRTQKNVHYIFDPYTWDLDSLKSVLTRVNNDSA